jgi:N-acetylglucosaminyl-diphospho-decaprenol L-rhamnosyltransferase
MEKLDPVIIAIVGYRNAADVRACLAALANSTAKDFQISICENGGPASYRALREALGGLVDFTDPPPARIDERVAEACSGRLRPGGQPIRIYGAMANLGYAGGVNLCIRQMGPSAKWSAIWILNPDTEPEPGALAALIARTAEGPYGIVASRLAFKSTQRIQSYGGRWRPLLGRGLNIGMNAPLNAKPDVQAIEREMTYVSGASLFASRDYIENVGLMDESYFLYCEDVDWCLRRGERRLGYAHDAIVYHVHGTTIGSNTSRKARSALSVYLDERNKLRLTRRFYQAGYPWALLISLALTLQYLRAGAPRNFLVALTGWFAGLRGEVGLPKRFSRRENERTSA